jgi:hypothetical protein
MGCSREPPVRYRWSCQSTKAAPSVRGRGKPLRGSMPLIPTEDEHEKKLPIRSA